MEQFVPELHSYFWNFISLFERLRTRLVRKFGSQHQSIAVPQCHCLCMISSLPVCLSVFCAMLVLRSLSSFIYIIIHLHLFVYLYTSGPVLHIYFSLIWICISIFMPVYVCILMRTYFSRANKRTLGRPKVD